MVNYAGLEAEDLPRAMELLGLGVEAYNRKNGK